MRGARQGESRVGATCAVGERRGGLSVCVPPQGDKTRFRTRPEADTVSGACPALSRTFGPAGRRPRDPADDLPTLGASAAMPCEHGCIPEGGRVSDTQAMRWMLTSYDIGGHADTSPDVRAPLEQRLADEYASALLSRYLRGDRSITAQLRDRLLQLRT